MERKRNRKEVDAAAENQDAAVVLAAVNVALGAAEVAAAENQDAAVVKIISKYIV